MLIQLSLIYSLFFSTNLKISIVSFASLTSCTRIILAPCISDIVLTTVVPLSAWLFSIFNRLLIMDFLEEPTKIGGLILTDNVNEDNRYLNFGKNAKEFSKEFEWDKIVKKYIKLLS